MRLPQFLVGASPAPLTCSLVLGSPSRYPGQGIAEDVCTTSPSHLYLSLFSFFPAFQGLAHVLHEGPPEEPIEFGISLP